jgi:hypothetical protein
MISSSPAMGKMRLETALVLPGENPDLDLIIDSTIGGHKLQRADEHAQAVIPSNRAHCGLHPAVIYS